MSFPTIKFKRGTTAQCDAVTPASGEPLYDETVEQLRMGDGSTAGGKKVAMQDIGVSRTFLANAFQFPAPGTDWTPTANGANLPVGKTAKTIWLPLNFLKIGDVITSYKLVGDAIIAGTSTLDCKLVSLNKADPLTTTDITSGAITQVTADGNFDAEANCADTTVETDKQYYLEITGTTDAADQFNIMGAEVAVTRLP